MQPELFQARQAKQMQDGRMRAFHGYVFEQLQTQRKDEILHRARERVALWKREKLCSNYYIRFWTSVVNAENTEIFKSKVLDASERRAVGMMQNTPFSFMLKELR